MSDDLDIWHDVQIYSDGISASTYSQSSEEADPVVEDETWYTWDEISSMREHKMAIKTLRILKQQYDPDSDEYADISQTIFYLKSE